MSSISRDDEGPVVATYRWFNDLLGREAPVTEEEVGRYWTPDAEMITNGQLKCAGLPAFAAHFNEIRHKLRSWEVELPLKMEMREGDRVGVHYLIRAITTEGQPSDVLIAAFFDLRDGKLLRMTEVAHFEGATLQLDNH